MVLRSYSLAGDDRGAGGNMAGVDDLALPAVTPRQHATAIAGDAGRFERLWQEHYPAVHAHAARRVGARADEVCAEVFLIAWRRLDELPRDELPWLLAASRNVIGTAWRGDARRARLQDRLDTEPSLAGDAPGDECDPELSTALARLDERDRELLLLVYWEGLTPSRAARAIGLAPATARTRLWRLRRKLRRELIGQEADDE
jgi:RNA polymerase sigma-70 factor (ECF subfamily)